MLSTQLSTLECPIIVIGTESSGKTALINSMIGFTLGHSLSTTATRNITFIKCRRNVNNVLPRVYFKTSSALFTSTLDDRACEIPFPFKEKIKELTNSMEEFGDASIELLVEYAKFEQDFTIIDCPGIRQSSSSDNDKIFSITSRVIDLFRDDCIVCCCFCQSSALSIEVLKRYHLLSLLHTGRVKPIFTKVDTFSGNLNGLANNLNDAKWCTEKKVYLMSLPFFEDSFNGVNDGLPLTLRGDVDFYSSEGDAKIKISKQVCESVAAKLKVRNENQIDLDFGLINLMTCIQQDRHQAIRQSLENRQAKLRVELDEVDQSLKSDLNLVGKMELVEKLLLVIGQCYSMVMPELRVDRLTLLNSQYGITLRDEMLKLNDTMGYSTFHQDESNTVLFGYLMLKRDSDWIGNLVHSIPVQQFITGQQDEEVVQLQPKFKKKRLDSRMVSEMVSNDELTDLCVGNSLKVKFFKLFTDISDLHLEKVRNMIRHILEAAIKNCGMLDTDGGELIVKSGNGLLDGILKARCQEFGIKLDKLFTKTDNIESDCNMVKVEFMERGLEIANALLNARMEWCRVIKEDCDVMVERTRLNLKRRREELLKDLDLIGCKL